MLGKQIKHNSTRTHKKSQIHNLSLQFRKASTTKEGKELEFLDILHKIKSSEINGFKTVNHIQGKWPLLFFYRI